LNGTTVFVNPDLIRSMEPSPDTLLAFVDGERLMVRESPEDVRAKIVEYRRDCLLGPRAGQSLAGAAAWT
jgi:flagellar protein FlbD